MRETAQMSGALQRLSLIEATRRELNWFRGSWALKRMRTISEFAEQEIVLPDSGPFKGFRFRQSRQPYCREWFRCIESGQWRENIALGPTQSGKTLQCFAIPTLYHLFEVKEQVICGLPSMDMASDKWQQDLKPIIEASRYRDLLPRTGAGSQGGTKLESVTFRNGTVLKFMSAGGGDKKRAGFTSRVICITELSDFGDISENSDESTKYNQLKGRAAAFGSPAGGFLIYGECTVTTSNNIVWAKYEKGTHSRLFCPCVHCGEYVSPERENLFGWQDCDNEIDAGVKSVFICPQCGGFWTDQQREEMNRSLKLVHRGQTIDKEGIITGELPKTRTLGFRWNAFNNLFKSAGDIGEAEWNAMNAENSDEEEVALRQITWAIPTEPVAWESVEIDRHAVQRKVIDTLPRGMVPVGAEFLTAGIDVGKWLLHWTVGAAIPVGDDLWWTHVVNYGIEEVSSDSHHLRRALEIAFLKIQELFQQGFVVQGRGESWMPWQIFVDSGWKPEEVHYICHKLGPDRYRATQGRGKGQRVEAAYSSPKDTTNTIIQIGEQWHLETLKEGPNAGCNLLPFNANHWKTQVHEGIKTPAGQPGSMSLFHGGPKDHLKFNQHLTAEKQMEEYEPEKRGMVKVWKRIRQANHWLDSTAGMLVAQDFCKQHLEMQKRQQAAGVKPLLVGSDGKPLLGR